MPGGEELAALAHVLAVVVGLGGLSADLLTDAQLRRTEGIEAYAVAASTYRRGARRDVVALALILVSGAVVAALSGGAISLADQWVWGSALCYAAVAVTMQGQVVPCRRRALVLLGELAGSRPTEAGTKRTELGALTRRLRLASVVIHALAAAALTLGVLRPGN